MIKPGLLVCGDVQPLAYGLGSFAPWREWRGLIGKVQRTAVQYPAGAQPPTGRQRGRCKPRADVSAAME